jgi:hypothetical protein
VNVWSKFGSETSIRIWRWAFLGIGLISLIDFARRTVAILHGSATGQGITAYWLLNRFLELLAGFGGPWLWWMTRARNDVADEPTEV